MAIIVRLMVIPGYQQQAKKRRAKVAELVDAPDLGSGAERCGGSSPPFRTKGVAGLAISAAVMVRSLGCSRQGRCDRA